MVEKYVVDGKVAVLYSPGFGAGWSTWGEPDMAFDDQLVRAFLRGGAEALREALHERYPDAYDGGARDVAIEWIKEGTAFRINEYDGSESIEYITPDSFLVA